MRDGPSLRLSNLASVAASSVAASKVINSHYSVIRESSKTEIIGRKVGTYQGRKLDTYLGRKVRRQT